MEVGIRYQFTLVTILNRYVTELCIVNGRKFRIANPVRGLLSFDIRSLVWVLLFLWGLGLPMLFSLGFLEKMGNRVTYPGCYNL